MDVTHYESIGKFKSAHFSVDSYYTDLVTIKPHTKANSLYLELAHRVKGPPNSPLFLIYRSPSGATIYYLKLSCPNKKGGGITIERIYSQE